MALLLVTSSFLPGFAWGLAITNAKIVKTYSAFSSPVDPAHILTQADLDISYALASTLIAWDSSMQPTTALANKWESISEFKASVQLRADAKWSDGSTITAQEVVKSLERAKREHGEELKSLFEMVKGISAKGSHIVFFELNTPVAKSGLYRKLTEPMYGILFVKKDGNIDLKKSSGPFSLDSSSASEISMNVNRHWFDYNSRMPDLAVIRKPTVSGNPQSFTTDSWANLTPASSLIPQELAKEYEKARLGILKRNLDKIFLFTPSQKLSNSTGRKLFQALNSHLQRQGVVKGLNGYTLSPQFYPPGYALFNPEFPKAASAEVPTEFKIRPLTILMVESAVSRLLRYGLSDSIQEATGQKPTIRFIALGDLDKERSDGQFDLMAASIPVNDLNVDGAMAFFFGLNPPLIPSAGAGEGNFKLRIEKAKNLESQAARNSDYRKIMTEATQDGCLLPLFHYSTVVLAKDGIIISQAQTTDETIAFSKVRFP